MKKFLALLLTLTLLLNGNQFVYAEELIDANVGVGYTSVKDYLKSLSVPDDQIEKYIDDTYKHIVVTGAITSHKNYSSTMPNQTWIIGIKGNVDAVHLETTQGYNKFIFNKGSEGAKFYFYVLFLSGSQLSYSASPRIYDGTATDWSWKDISGTKYFLTSVKFSDNNATLANLNAFKYSDFDIYVTDSIATLCPTIALQIASSNNIIYRANSAYESVHKGSEVSYTTTAPITTTIDCEYIVILPKSLDMKGEPETKFDVKAKGRLVPSLQLSVSVEPKIKMVRSSDDSEHEASVTLDSVFKCDDLNEDTYTVREGTVSFPTTDFGTYSGEMHFTITVEPVSNQSQENN